ncbi:MAG: hypothetical protein ACOY0T_25630 [Myxococcota bacterium]
MARRSAPRPGLAKTGAQPLVFRRVVELVRSSDYRLRQLFERADVMSEGKVREEPDGRTYYGSTSVLLPFVSQGGGVPDESAAEMLRMLAYDPHARTRAIRIACLEAQVRARSPIGRVRAEFSTRRDRRGLCLDVEVEARVFEEPARVTPTAENETASVRSPRRR